MHPMMVKRELAEVRSKLAGLNASAGYRFNSIVEMMDQLMDTLATEEGTSLEIQAAYLAAFPNECARPKCWNHHNLGDGSLCDACMQEDLDDHG